MSKTEMPKTKTTKINLRLPDMTRKPKILSGHFMVSGT